MSAEMFAHNINIALQFTVDPVGNYLGVEDERLIAACGIIPNFVNRFAEDETFEQQIDANYGFPTHWGEADIDERGVYRYPGDPDMYPLMSCERTDKSETLYIYQYGMVAVRKADGTARSARCD